jgi:hypothetical protein
MVAQPTVWPADCAGTLSQSASGTGSPGYSNQEIFSQNAANLIPQPVPFAIYGGNKRADRPEGGFYVRQEDTARTLDSSQGLNPTYSQGGTGVLQPFTKAKRAQSVTDDKTWVDGQVNPTLSLFDQGDTRATTVAVAFTPGNLARGAGASPNAEVSQTLQSQHGRGATDQHPCVAFGTDCYNGAITGDVAATMGTPGSSVNASGPTVMQAMAFKTGNSAKARSNAESSEVTPTLGSDAGGNTIPAVAFHPLQDPISSTDGSTHCMGTGGSQGHASIAVAFANRTRDGIKMPEIMADGVTPALTNPGGGGRSDAINVAVAFQQNQLGEVRCGNIAGTVNTNSNASGRNTPMAMQAMTVRRLTPRECERLQGFPDDYTLIPWRKKQAEDCPDGPRYKALGNSMAVNCMAWIGERIAALENNR